MPEFLAGTCARRDAPGTAVPRAPSPGPRIRSANGGTGPFRGRLVVPDDQTRWYPWPAWPAPGQARARITRS
jgi:hypothetical protein